MRLKGSQRRGGRAISEPRHNCVDGPHNPMETKRSTHGGQMVVVRPPSGFTPGRRNSGVRLGTGYNALTVSFWINLQWSGGDAAKTRTVSCDM